MTDSKLASAQPYELFMFARKHGLTVSQARKILEQFGPDRQGADAAAKALTESDLDMRPDGTINFPSSAGGALGGSPAGCCDL